MNIGAIEGLLKNGPVAKGDLINALIKSQSITRAEAVTAINYHLTGNLLESSPDGIVKVISWVGDIAGDNRCRPLPKNLEEDVVLAHVTVAMESNGAMTKGELRDKLSHDLQIGANRASAIMDRLVNKKLLSIRRDIELGPKKWIGLFDDTSLSDADAAENIVKYIESYLAEGAMKKSDLTVSLARDVPMGKNRATKTINSLLGEKLIEVKEVGGRTLWIDLINRENEEE